MHGELKKLYENLTSKVLGTELASELILTALLAEGHVLVQGAPGMGKTSLARIVAESIDAEFRRIQFTPDLLPSEILGFNIYDQGERKFVFHRGPIFGNVILADEINRASPRTQSALLEAMNETQVTIDGQTYHLKKPFFVIATENHLSSVGTYPLPDSQLDRFIISFNLTHPDPKTSIEILNIHTRGIPYKETTHIITAEALIKMQADVKNVHVEANMMDYIVRLCAAISENKDVSGGPSTRASIALMNVARAQAYIQGRDAVYPDDIKKVLPFVLRHRIVMKSGSVRHDHIVESLLHDISNSISVPMD